MTLLNEAGLEYQLAGVNTERARKIPEQLEASVARTHRPWSSMPLGGFSSIVDLSLAGPLARGRLALTCDGVGTKLLLAKSDADYRNIGRDGVAMCVNDLLVMGAKPLAVLDYVAMGSLDERKLLSLVEGMAEACADVGCTLSGGETAEMPGVYKDNDFDLACFAVGLVEGHDLGSASIKEGDRVVGLPSSGLHSNGFSLVRKAITEGVFDLDKTAPFCTDKATLREVLLEPTKLYHREVFDVLLRDSNKVRVMAHITGGGLFDNLERVMSKNKVARLDRDSFEVPKIFCWLRDFCGISEKGLWSSLNMGIGYVAVVSEDFRSDETIDIGVIENADTTTDRVVWQ